MIAVLTWRVRVIPLLLFIPEEFTAIPPNTATSINHAAACLRARNRYPAIASVMTTTLRRRGWSDRECLLNPRRADGAD